MSEIIEDHILNKYDILEKVGRGAYGFVWKVEDKKTKKIYALKKIFDAFQHSTDAQRTYREIAYLEQLNHQNIIKLYNVIKAQNNKDIYLIFEYMDIDLYSAIKENILNQKHKKYIVYQIAKGLKYIHSASLIHRDIKPSNILLNADCLVKLCDFGLVRSLHQLQQPNMILTEYIATRWYRAPEIVLGSNKYSKAIDIWSFGCLIAELYKNRPLFPGNSTLNQLQKILMWTGYPKQEDLQMYAEDNSYTMLEDMRYVKQRNKKDYINCDETLLDLLKQMLEFNPKKRITIQQIMLHPYMSQFHDDANEPICNKAIKPKINDNRKLGLKEYRYLIYKQIGDKSIPKAFEIKKMSNYNSNRKKSIVSKENDKDKDIQSKSNQRQFQYTKTLIFETDMQQHPIHKNMYQNHTKIRQKHITQVMDRPKRKRKPIDHVQLRYQGHYLHPFIAQVPFRKSRQTIYSKQKKGNVKIPSLKYNF